MNRTEFSELMAWISQACPGTKIDNLTPKVWFELLKDLTFEDAKAGVNQVAKTKPFVHPSEIREQVKILRRDRQERNPVLEVVDGGDDALYGVQFRALIRTISDGGRGLGGVLGAIEAVEETAAGPLDASVEARALAHGLDPEFVRLRDGSLTIACPWCKALPGEVCVTGDGTALTREPAHRIRLESTDPPLVEPVPRPSREQRLAELSALLESEGVEHG